MVKFIYSFDEQNTANKLFNGNIKGTAGYEKHRKPDRTEKETFSGLNKNMHGYQSSFTDTKRVTKVCWRLE